MCKPIIIIIVVLRGFLQICRKMSVERRYADIVMAETVTRLVCVRL